LGMLSKCEKPSNTALDAFLDHTLARYLHIGVACLSFSPLLNSTLAMNESRTLQPVVYAVSVLCDIFDQQLAQTAAALCILNNAASPVFDTSVLPQIHTT
jgi:hypothetical protein